MLSIRLESERDMYTILICDDDKDIRRALKIYLSGEGYRTLEAADGKQCLELLEKEAVDLILMDVMMPGLDGLGATMQLRQESSVPVILLTAKSEDTDKILGLTVGADDYITKPFNPLELIARVKAQLRRVSWSASAQERRDEPLLRCGSLEMDDKAKRVRLAGEEIALTPTEYDILHLLMENPGKVFSSAEIYRIVWQGAPYGAQNTVAVHIRHLREKIELDPANPRCLKVVWGKGYKLEAGR